MHTYHDIQERSFSLEIYYRQPIYKNLSEQYLLIMFFNIIFTVPIKISILSKIHLFQKFNLGLIIKFKLEHITNNCIDFCYNY